MKECNDQPWCVFDVGLVWKQVLLTVFFFFFLQADQLTEEQIAGKNYFTAVCGIVYQWMSPHPFLLLNELLEVRKVITASSTPPEVKQNNKEKGYAVEVVTF